ncbi:MAG: HAMP domain-containing protein, partial [Burkholderiales bacterium]|nr:HAMP domain-containing protein [Burkholderiales bacterium]
MKTNTVAARRLLDLNIGAKITILLALVAAPLALLAYIYVAQVMKDEAFARKEIAGSIYLGKIWTAYAAAATGDAGRMNAAAAALRSQAAEADAAFGSQAAVAEFVASLGKGNATAALAAGQLAMRKVADGSNLTLDPDIDSYYLIDVIASRFPIVVSASSDFIHATDSAVARGTASIADYGAMSRSMSSLDDAITGAKAAYATALDQTADRQMANDLKQLAASFAQRVDAFETQGEALMRKAEAGVAATPADRQALKAASDALMADIEVVVEKTDRALVQILEARVSRLRGELARNLGMAGLSILIVLVLAVLFARTIQRPIAKLTDVIRGFQSGDYKQDVPYTENRNEVGEIARALKMFQGLGAQQTLTLAALDGSPTMLMITDPEERIIYMSSALGRLIRQLEPTLRSSNPSFTLEGMKGQHIDCYRTNAALKRDLISDNGETRKVRYVVAGRTILVDMAYIRGAQKDRIGHTLEWRDVTAELEAEAEVAGVVSAASRGDFSSRIPVEGKVGFVREIAGGMNRVSETVETVMNDFAATLSAVSGGDLTRTVDADYAGVFGELRNGLNDTIAKLSDTVATIQTTAIDVSGAAREINAGADDLSRRTEEQASSLEQTAATTEELAASVKASAQSSRQAVDLAEEAMKVA